MSKLDDIKSLRGSQLQRMTGASPKPRPAQKIIDGLKEAVASVQTVDPKPAKKRAKSSGAEGKTFVESPAKSSAIPSSDTLRPVVPAPETKSKGGRPKTTGEPWKAEGISKALWYRRRAKSEASKGKKDE